MKVFQRNFQELLKTPSAINPEVVVNKSLSVVEKLQFVQWDIFESSCINLCECTKITAVLQLTLRHGPKYLSRTSPYHAQYNPVL